MAVLIELKCLSVEAVGKMIFEFDKGRKIGIIILEG